MDYLIYKIIHIVGLMGIFSAMGGLIGADVRKPATLGIYGMIHGISLLALFISGFGLQAKLGLGFPIWLIAKIIIWALMGGMIVVLKRRLIPVGQAWILMIVLGGVAAYLAIYKPF